MTQFTTTVHNSEVMTGRQLDICCCKSQI